MSSEPMDWATYSIGRKLLFEERIGTRLREVRRDEDRKFAEATKRLQRLKGA